MSFTPRACAWCVRARALERRQERVVDVDRAAGERARRPRRRGSACSARGRPSSTRSASTSSEERRSRLGRRPRSPPGKVVRQAVAGDKRLVVPGSRRPRRCRRRSRRSPPVEQVVQAVALARDGDEDPRPMAASWSSQRHAKLVGHGRERGAPRVGPCSALVGEVDAHEEAPSSGSPNCWLSMMLPPPSAMAGDGVDDPAPIGAGQGEDQLAAVAHRHRPGLRAA